VRRTRVLYFVGSFEQGGAERQVAELVKNMPRARFDVHVAVCNRGDQFGYDLSPRSFHDLRTPRGPSAATLVALVRLVRALDPDIVHAVHDPQNSYARLAVTLARRGAAIGSLRCTRLPERTIRRERLTHGLGAALIVNSHAIREELARARISGVEVVENGVDGSRFAPLDLPTRMAERARFGIDGATFVVPARIAYQKNQLAVVRAVAALRSRGTWPRIARVVFAGRVETHSDYARCVDASIRKLNVGDVIRRIEPVRDAEHLLAAADATLLPSHFEGLPNVVLESLACGTPAIVSHAANVDGLVRDGVTGIVTGDTHEDVGHGMSRFLAMSMGERAALGLRGRGDVRARFGIARMVDGTCAIYDRISRTSIARRREAA